VGGVLVDCGETTSSIKCSTYDHLGPERNNAAPVGTGSHFRRHGSGLGRERTKGSTVPELSRLLTCEATESGIESPEAEVLICRISRTSNDISEAIYNKRNEASGTLNGPL
jgi:hypothetical protein